MPPALGRNSATLTMTAYDYGDDGDEPFANRDDLHGYDPEAPLRH